MSTVLRQWDAAVIGGGPAGCSSAISLAERGLKVILFEAKTYPHDKLCGEFLSPECGDLLDRLGVKNRIDDLGAVAIKRVLISAPDQTAWESPLPAPAMGISRKILDAALADRARQLGVEVREASRVCDISGNLEHGFCITTDPLSGQEQIQARAVISAHGKRGAIDRVLGRRFLEQHQPYVAIKAHFNGPRIPGRIELHTFPGGYCGMSEIEGDARVVCLLVHEQVFQTQGGKGPEAVDRFIRWMRAQNLYLNAWMQWAERIHTRWISIAQVPFVPKPAISRDVLMSGDSAGLIAPLAGNGIAMALEGGLLAADHLAGFLLGERSAADLKHGYPSAWGKAFSLRLRLGRLLQPVMLNPKAASLALKTLNALPSLGQFLINHTRSTVTHPIAPVEKV